MTSYHVSIEIGCPNDGVQFNRYGLKGAQSVQ